MTDPNRPSNRIQAASIVGHDRFMSYDSAMDVFERVRDTECYTKIAALFSDHIDTERAMLSFNGYIVEIARGMNAAEGTKMDGTTQIKPKETLLAAPYKDARLAMFEADRKIIDLFDSLNTKGKTSAQELADELMFVIRQEVTQRNLEVQPSSTIQTKTQYNSNPFLDRLNELPPH